MPTRPRGRGRAGRALASIALCLFFALPARADPGKALRLIFVGDLMAHPVLFAMSNYHDIYQGIEDILQGSDLTFANLEFPVDSTRPLAGYPLFNADRDYVSAALDAGIDVFSVANNHAFDGGEEGVLQSLRTLTSLAGQPQRRLFFSGIRGNPQRPFLPETIVVKGVRIGFIAAAQFLNEPGGGRYVQVVDYNDREAAESFLDFVKETSPLFDLFIVSYHGDREYSAEPDPAKRAFFHQLVENGAQIVFAHHPHVLQAYETVSVGASKRLIMNSMGNFVSGMAFWDNPPDPDGWLAPTGDSIMLCVDVTFGAPGGASVSRATAVPIANYRNAQGGIVVLKLDDLADGRAGAPPAWKAYFSERRARIAKLLAAAAPGPVTCFSLSASAR